LAELGKNPHDASHGIRHSYFFDSLSVGNGGENKSRGGVRKGGRGVQKGRRGVEAGGRLVKRKKPNDSIQVGRGKRNRGTNEREK